MMRGKWSFVALVLFLLATTSQAKDYRLDRAFVQMQIYPDGSIRVSEDITVDYTGSFTFGYRDIPKGHWRINDVTVFEGARPLRTELSDRRQETRIKWHFTANNQAKTFTIKYVLEDAIICYDDVCDLNWEVWGDGWEKRLSEIEGRIILPQTVDDPKDVHTWGHPELKRGRIAMHEDMKSVIFQAFDVPARQWIEIRTVYPRQQMREGGNYITMAGPGLDGIIDEEKNYQPPKKDDFPFYSFMALMGTGLYAAVGIILFGIMDNRGIWISPTIKKAFGISIVCAIAASIIVFAYDQGFINIGDLFFMPVFIVFQACIFLLCWSLWGHEPKTGYMGIYEREIPYEYGPAVVSALMNHHNKKPRREVMGAEIMSLCIKGRLIISCIDLEAGMFGKKEDYEIRILDTSEDGLPSSQRFTLRMIRQMAEYTFEKPDLFRGRITAKKVKDKTPDRVTLKQMEEYLMAQPAKSHEWFKKWEKLVSKEAKQGDLFDKHDGLWQYIILSLGVSGIIFIAWGPFFAASTAFAARILYDISPGALFKRTKKGALHHARWNALKGFLSDYSALESVGPQYLPLWEQYLVYSIPLGVAHKVEKAMDNVFRDYRGGQKSRIFASGAMGSSALRFGSATRGFSRAFAKSSPTSGSSGFSGGGGRGGGGGGGGFG